MAPEQEHEERPSAQEVPRLCDEAHKEEETSKLLETMDQTKIVHTKDQVASAARKCDPLPCSGVHQKTPPVRPSKVRKIRHLLWYRCALAAAIFFLFYMLYSFPD